MLDIFQPRAVALRHLRTALEILIIVSVARVLMPIVLVHTRRCTMLVLAAMGGIIESSRNLKQLRRRKNKKARFLRLVRQTAHQRQ